MSNSYLKAGGSAGSKGVEFQMDLLSIFLLNALQNIEEDWKLSTENMLAGKFDDVVLEISDGSAILLQAKHKENKKITFDQFLSANTKNDDFSLPKYFFSYLDIKTKFPVKSVIICTNTHVDVKTKKFLNQNNTCKDSILHYENGASYFTFGEEILKDLMANAENYQNSISKGKDTKETVITENNVKEFLKHLQIYLEYPSGNDLRKIVEKLLSGSTRYGNLSRNMLHRDLHQKVKDWFEQPKGEYLTKLHAKAMLCEIKSEKYRLLLENYKLFFKSNDFSITNSKNVFHVVAEEGYLLHLMKIYRSLQQNDNKILYAGNDDGSDVQEEVIKAFELPLYTYLIIVSPTFSELVINELCTKLRDILHTRKYKRVIFVAELNNKLAQRMKSVGIDYDTICNIPTLDDLSDETQVKLLKKKNIVFQGEEVSLTELFPEHITEDHKKSIKTKILEKLVKGEQIKVGMKLTDLEEDVSRYYIYRKLNKIGNEDENGKERKPTISEEDIYNVKGKVVLISDGAGAGKTTVLKNLALTIKETHPRLWVIRVELNDCTKVLKDSLKQDRPINVHELLSCRNTTRLTNELEEILFSQKGMIVLMLDGVDEIIPRFKTLIMNLLLETQKAENMRKLFVTARPHMEQELVTQLKLVTSFTLVPLTQQNQTNFFINYWSHTLKLEGENKSKCERYAMALISKISLLTGNWYGDVKFVSSPLHARMIAEVFLGSSSSGKWKGCKEYLSEDEVEPRLENVSMAKLYEMFIDKKEDIFLEKGNPSGNEIANQALMDQFKEYMAYHRSLALEVVLDATKYILFSSYQSSVGDKKEITMLMVGMLQKLDNKYRFVHRTFAEYFVAESILRELQLQNTNAEFQKFLIDEVLVNKEYNIICHFLDNLLQDNISTLPSNIFNSYMSHVNDTKNSNLIHLLAADGNTEIIRFILKCIDFNITTENEEEGNKETSDTYRESVTTTANTLNVLKYLVGLYGIDIRGNKDRTPLHNAILAGHLDTVKFLVEMGADINRRSKLRDTALHFAASSGNADILEFLLKRVQDVNIMDMKSYTPLHFAVMNSKKDIVELLVKYGADINIGNVDGNTALHFAVERGGLNILELLMKDNTDIDVKNKEGFTPLHFAARKGSFDMVEFLVKHAANINIANKKGYTAIHFAVKENSFDILEFLVKHDANINISTKEGYSGLHFAVQKGNLDIVGFLVRHGANINFMTEEGYTALHLAASASNFDIVKFLVEHDADVNVANKKGYMALHLAAGRGSLNIVEFLIKNNAAVNVADLEGYTALHFAAGSNNLDIVKLLVGLNTDINIRTQEGYTPLHFASKNAISILLNSS